MGVGIENRVGSKRSVRAVSFSVLISCGGTARSNPNFRITTNRPERAWRREYQEF